MIEYHKNNLTESGDYILSHSQLCKLDPSMGGHPKIFYRTINEPASEDKSPSLERGDLLHLWIEKKDNFVIADLDKPTEKLGQFADTFHEYYNKKKYLEDPTFAHFAKQDGIIQINDSMTYNELYKKLHKGTIPTENEFALFVGCVRFARKVVNYQSNWGETKILEQFDKTVKYIQFLKEADGRVILTPQTKDILTNCHSALQEHPFANYLLFQLEGEHELELNWSVPITDPITGDKIMDLNRKCKIDKIVADNVHKKITIIDTKTTSVPVSLFAANLDSPYWKYRYGRQLASYEIGWFLSNPQLYSGDWEVELFNVVVQTKDEFPVQVYRTSIKSSYAFRTEIFGLEQRAAYHIRNNQWNLTMEESKASDLNKYIQL